MKFATWAVICLTTLVAFSVSQFSTGYAASNQRFEYRKVQLPVHFGKGSEEILNKLGSQGWEIAYGSGHVVFMKRSW